ncbi:hypothetical protein RB195_005162 [Necator americanus]|uniref:Leucine Rich repeat-containing domain protein n=1 Tax=Necator americanus TaxID=51031 RepID=A0ABR1BPH4_NECAM
MPLRKRLRSKRCDSGDRIVVGPLLARLIAAPRNSPTSIPNPTGPPHCFQRCRLRNCFEFQAELIVLIVSTVHSFWTFRRNCNEARSLKTSTTALRQHQVSWEKVGFNRMRSVNILQRMDQPLNLKQLLDKAACKALFPITIRHVCLTGILLTVTIMDTLTTLTNLRHLDLIGCVVDTQLAAEYVGKFALMSNLDELSVPPSMYSFSVKDDKSPPFNFRKLHLSKLSAYMECFDENSFFDALETVMPRKLEALTLYGNYYPLKRSKKYSQWRKFEILFAAMIPQVRSPWWMKEESALMSHIVRCPPYKVSDDFRPMRSTAASWRFDQATLDSEEAPQERPTINRFLRFMRPEGPPLAIAPAPRAVPEPPPPPVRRERIRRRPNVPTVAEEQNPVPVVISLPHNGAVAAPVAALVPNVEAAPAPALPAASAIPNDVSPVPEAPPHDGEAVAEAPPLNPPGQTAIPEQTAQVDQRNTAAELLEQAHRGGQTIEAGGTLSQQQTMHVGGAPGAAAADHTQPMAQPTEIPLVNTQPASATVEGNVNGAQRGTIAADGSSEQSMQQTQRAPAGNSAQNITPLPEPANNVGDEQGVQERHDDEHINMMLQGMLQALVEEIVLDAMNDERMENNATDPPPVVSSDATAPNRTNATNTSTTPTPSTPPPSEAQQPQALPRANNQNTQH